MDMYCFFKKTIALTKIVALALSIDAEAYSDSWKSDKAAECCNFFAPGA